jgi:hypothetical protein
MGNGGMNFNQLMPGQRVRTRIRILRLRQWAHPDSCHLHDDLEEGEPFKVRGLHTVERWADLEAENYYPLNLRVSAEEMAMLFVFA